MNILRSLFGRRAARRLPSSRRLSAPIEGVTPARSLPLGSRVYAVGDVHGRLDCLLMLETIIARDRREYPEPQDTRIIFVGDYVDRGPDSRGVLNVLSRGHLAGLPVQCLLGNHEDGMMRFLGNPEKAGAWLMHGGLTTLASYGVKAGSNWKERLVEIRDELDMALPIRHRSFLSSLPLSVEMGDYLFVHVAICPGIPLDRQRREHLLSIREPFLSERNLPWRVVHGHTIIEKPAISASRVALDTGAYATGRLSCVVIEGSDTRILST